jgi:hypothetical protein
VTREESCTRGDRTQRDKQTNRQRQEADSDSDRDREIEDRGRQENIFSGQQGKKDNQQYKLLAIIHSIITFSMKCNYYAGT